MSSNHLFLIDPQNDFMDLPDSALGVAGSTEDMRTLAKLVWSLGPSLSGATVTLDFHPYVAIERTTFWVRGDLSPVEPFTRITAEDVRCERFIPRNVRLKSDVLKVLRSMENMGATLIVWPVHCVAGTWGSNIYEPVAKELFAWSEKFHRPVRVVTKGMNPMVEQFGAFEAVAPLPDDPQTQFNTELAESLAMSAKTLLVAGEASSHCVAKSVMQFLDFLVNFKKPKVERILLLADCMSPVSGYEDDAAEFFSEAVLCGKGLGIDISIVNAQGLEIETLLD